MLWSPCCPRDSQESSPAPQFKGINSLVLCLLYSPVLTTEHDHHSFDYTDLCQQTAVSVFNILSRFVIAFLTRSIHPLISWLQLPLAMISEPKKRKSVTIFTFCLSICHEVMGPDAMILVFLIFSLRPTFSLSFIIIKRFFSSSFLSVVSATYLRLLMLLLPILTPACNSSNLAFLTMCSVYRLNKQGDNRQPCHTPFSILNQSFYTGF